MGSADLMPRNLDRRVEALFPVQDEIVRHRVRRDFEREWRDTVNAWRLNSDGTYERLKPTHEMPEFDSQAAAIGVNAEGEVVG